MKKFPNYKQTEAKDCGPTCIKIIAKHYDKLINTQQLHNLSETSRERSSLLGLSEAVKAVGLRSLCVKLSYNKLEEAVLPCIVHWNKNHFVVAYKITKDLIYVSDPAHGLIAYTKKEFIKQWIGNNANENTEDGVVLLIKTTPKFFKEGFEEDKVFGFSFIFKYVFKHKSPVIQLILGLLAGSLLQLIFPFLTQSVVDVGIKNQDVNFVYLVLFVQLTLFFRKSFFHQIKQVVNR